ncbi:hypothetical protein DF186_16460, partial [Enterococcus hirae]
IDHDRTGRRGGLRLDLVLAVGAPAVQHLGEAGRDLFGEGLPIVDDGRPLVAEVQRSLVQGVVVVVEPLAHRGDQLVERDGVLDHPAAVVA